MSTLHVYENEVTDWIVAESSDEARAIGLEQSGDSEEYKDLEYTQCPDDQPLTVHSDDGPVGNESETMTCAEWCAKEGKGFLCSTEY